MKRFSGSAGGPHQNVIAAFATQMLEVNTPKFSNYISQVIIISKTLASELINLGYKISTNGTDNHIVLYYIFRQRNYWE